MFNEPSLFQSSETILFPYAEEVQILSFGRMLYLTATILWVMTCTTDIGEQIMDYALYYQSHNC